MSLQPRIYNTWHASCSLREVMDPHNIVVIGGSAGALRPLQAILVGLAAEPAIAVFVVLHTRADAPAMLASLLADAGPLEVRNAEDGEPIVAGTVLLAPPDRHLIIKDGFVRLTRAPRENLWRPAIDVLFRSAAVAYKGRVIGVILSGALDDGTAGIRAIKRCGGTAIVQSPADAEFPEMPHSAVRSAEVDYVLPQAEISGAIHRSVMRGVQTFTMVPEDLAMEVQFAELEALTTLNLENEVFPTASIAPAIIQDEAQPGCMTSPALPLPSLHDANTCAVSAALWAAIRHFEQRANLHRTVATEQVERGYRRAAEIYRERAQEAQVHADQLRKLLLESVRSRSTLPIGPTPERAHQSPVRVPPLLSCSSSDINR